jgi:hypothetical protein
VVDRRYWIELTMGKDDGQGLKKIKLTGKHYVSLVDNSVGEVAYEDGSVVIIRPAGLHPPQNAYEPTVAAKRLYDDPTAIYDIQHDHFGLLLANNKVKKEEEDDIYVMYRDLWDWLFDDGLIKNADFGEKAYTLYKGLVKIEEVQRDEELIVFKLPKNYCHYAGMKGEDGGRFDKARWHLGYCLLKMDRMVEDGLLDPLSDEAVHKLGLAPADSPATGQ